jgi:hypothetical protein
MHQLWKARIQDKAYEWSGRQHIWELTWGLRYLLFMILELWQPAILLPGLLYGAIYIADAYGTAAGFLLIGLANDVLFSEELELLRFYYGGKVNWDLNPHLNLDFGFSKLVLSHGHRTILKEETVVEVRPAVFVLSSLPLQKIALPLRKLRATLLRVRLCSVSHRCLFGTLSVCALKDIHESTPSGKKDWIVHLFFCLIQITVQWVEYGLVIGCGLSEVFAEAFWNGEGTIEDFDGAGDEPVTGSFLSEETSYLSKSRYLIPGIAGASIMIVIFWMFIISEIFFLFTCVTVVPREAAQGSAFGDTVSGMIHGTYHRCLLAECRCPTTFECAVA